MHLRSREESHKELLSWGVAGLLAGGPSFIGQLSVGIVVMLCFCTTGMETYKWLLEAADIVGCCAN